MLSDAEVLSNQVNAYNMLQVFSQEVYAEIIGVLNEWGGSRNAFTRDGGIVKKLKARIDDILERRKGHSNIHMAYVSIRNGSVDLVCSAWYVTDEYFGGQSVAYIEKRMELCQDQGGKIIDPMRPEPQFPIVDLAEVRDVRRTMMAEKEKYKQKIETLKHGVPYEFYKDLTF